MLKLKLINKPKMMKLKCNFTFPNIVLANLQEKKATPSEEVQEIVADIPYDGLSKVILDKIPSEYIVPEGEINIIENGVYDVTDKVSVDVNVESENNAEVDTITGSGSYTDKLNLIIKKLPKLIFTNKGTNIGGVFSNTKCKTIEFEASPLRAYSIVQNCTNLKKLSSFDGSLMIAGGSSCISGAINLEDFGGIINLGKAFRTTASENNSDYQMNVSKNTKLTHESLMNIINGLYDIKSAGVKPQQLILGSTNLVKLTEDEIAIATNKGWNIS